jgi:hypothetical protein
LRFTARLRTAQLSSGSSRPRICGVHVNKLAQRPCRPDGHGMRGLIVTIPAWRD